MKDKTNHSASESRVSPLPEAIETSFAGFLERMKLARQCSEWTTKAYREDLQTFGADIASPLKGLAGLTGGRHVGAQEHRWFRRGGRGGRFRVEPNRPEPAAAR